MFRLKLFFRYDIAIWFLGIVIRIGDALYNLTHTETVEFLDD